MIALWIIAALWLGFGVLRTISAPRLTWLLFDIKLHGRNWHTRALAFVLLIAIGIIAGPVFYVAVRIRGARK